MENQTKKIHDVIYSASHAKTLAKEESIEDLKSYIKQFFFCYGTDVFYKSGCEYSLRSLEDAKKEIAKDLCIYKYFDKGKQELFDARKFLESSEFKDNQYAPDIDFTKSKLFDQKEIMEGIEITRKKINMAKQFSPLDFKKQIDRNKYKDDIQKIYNHILNIWCSKNKELNEYILNWFACTFGGRKLRKMIYSQTNFERCGRGTIINFVNSILGKTMHKTSSVEEIIKYTKAFEGCLLINLDELPVSQENFKNVNDSLKTLSTEPTFICRDMFKTGYTQKNTFNIINTTNNDAIHFTQNNNSRYVCTEVDESMVGNTEYFTMMHKITDNDDIKILFYQDMMSRFKTLDNWNEDKVPETKTKQLKLIEALPMILKHIKETYILKNVNLDKRTNNFFEDYYVVSKDKTSKQKLGRDLKSIGIIPIKQSDSTYKYKRTHEELRQTYELKKWIDEENDVVNACDDDDYDNGVNKKDQSVPMVLKSAFEQLREENEQLKKKLEQYEAPRDSSIAREINQIEDLVNLKYIRKTMSDKMIERIQTGLQLCENIESFLELNTLAQDEHLFDDDDVKGITLNLSDVKKCYFS